MNSQLVFSGTTLNTITINEKTYITSRELAKALQYADPKAPTIIYHKNQSEFTSGMSEVVRTTTSGNLQKNTRVFSLRGAHLVAMFARTGKAKEFRRWVLDLIEKEISEQVAEMNRNRRFLVAVYDGKVQSVKDVTDKTVVNIKRYYQLIHDIRSMHGVLTELQERLRLVYGECSPEKFDTPLLEAVRNSDK